MCNEAPNGGPTARGPLRATRFFLTEVIALSGIAVLPSFMIGVTSTDSHSMGVCVFLSATDNVEKFRHKLVARDKGTTPCKNYIKVIWWCTLAAAKIALTDFEISGPIPSPSMKVTV